MPAAIFDLASLVKAVNEHATRSRATELKEFVNNPTAINTVAADIKEMRKTNPGYLKYFEKLVHGINVDGRKLIDIIRATHGGRRTKRSTRRTKRSRRARTRRQ
jgi:hypothetical protein